MPQDQQTTIAGEHLGPWDGKIGAWDAGELDRLGYSRTNKASWDHGYLTFYEALLRHRDVRRVLELGVFEGGSIATWRDYWPEAEIVGVDVNGMRDVPGARLVQADCTDPKAMGEAFAAGDFFDVVIDDATHQTDDILASFAIFESRVSDGGIYIIEDTLIDGGPWYAHTEDVADGLRTLGHHPLVIAPGRRWVVNGDDRGLWAFIAVEL